MIYCPEHIALKEMRSFIFFEWFKIFFTIPEKDYG